jgi:ArsR family transcriptional regulator
MIRGADGEEVKANDDKTNRRNAKTVFYNICMVRNAKGESMGTSVIHDLFEHQEHIETAARSLKAISHPLRLKILCVVGDEEVCVQDIVDAVGTSQSNISQHLGILRDKGVLQTRKDANRVYYRVADPRTLQLIGLMREVFCGVPTFKS